MVIVVTGVAGAGKTTVGRALAAALGWPFRDADELHSPDNVERMRRGEALTDAERGPWLQALARLVGQQVRADEPLVLACSALRRTHRAALLVDVPDADAVRLVHLTASPPLLAARLTARPDHFFPADLLASQLATLEPPAPDEPLPALTLDAALPVTELVHRIRQAFHV